MDYNLLPLSKVRSYVAEAAKQGVSEKARRSGFTRAYMKYGKRVLTMPSDTAGMQWTHKRWLFIKRTLPAYRANPTRRRWLALVMWAYMP